MEPTTFSTGHRHGLRQKSPNKDDFLNKFQTGFSLHDTLQQPTNPNEWQKYEQQRSEELRRQIQMKEAELENITQNKERIRMKVYNSLGGQVVPSVEKRNDSSIEFKSAYLNKETITPYRNSENSPFLINQTSAAQMRDVTPPKFNQNSLQQFTRPMDSITNQSVTYTPSNVPQSKAKPAVRPEDNSISQLQAENAQLKRRYNLVAAEFERVSVELNEHKHKLDSVQDQTHQLENQIDFQQNNTQPAQHLNNDVRLERDLNKKFQLRITDCSHSTQDIKNQLNMLKTERNRAAEQYQNYTGNLSQKVAVMKDIEQQQFLTQDQIEKASAQIDLINRQLKQDFKSNKDLSKILKRVIRERDDLEYKLLQLNETYDQAVNEISFERAQLEANNRRHIQLISSKVIFQSLEGMVKARKQAAINEFYNYSQFDNNCHTTLKLFAGILERCGQFTLKISLKRWFQNVMKPLQTKEQSMKVAGEIYLSKLSQRMFKRWQGRIQNRTNKYKSKIDSAKLIYQIKIKDIQKDIRRAFSIWRDLQINSRYREKCLKFLIRRQETKQIQNALVQWEYFNHQIDFIVRSHILINDFTNRQLQTITLNQLQQRTQLKKRIRHNKLRHLLKAWRDSAAYRKYMMGQNVGVAHLRKQSRNNLLSACFNALRLFKENEKFSMFYAKLSESMEPAVSDLIQFLGDASATVHKQKRSRALRCLIKNVALKISSYFTHWKGVSNGASLKTNQDMKTGLIRLYHNRLRLTFNHWKNSAAFIKILEQDNKIQHLIAQGISLTSEVDEVREAVSEGTERLERVQLKALQRATQICISRFLKTSVQVWSSRCRRLKAMEQQGAQVIINKIRISLCSAAFKLYKERVALIRLDLMSEARADSYINRRTARKVRIVFNAVCQYVHQYNRQRENLRVLVSNQDIWLQRRGFLRWIDRGNLKTAFLLKEVQNEQTFKFELLNKELGQVVKVYTSKSEKKNQLNLSHLDQARSVLKNAFARFYYIKAERGLTKWKQFLFFQRHQHSVLGKTVLHLRKSMFYVVKAAFQNWIALSKIKECKSEIKHVEILAVDSAQMIQHKHRLHISTSAQIIENQAENKTTIDLLSSRYNSLVNTVIRKNDLHNYQSKLRYLFYHWRTYSKRRIHSIKHFIHCLNKSCLQNGFTNIHAFTRDKLLTKHQNIAAEGLKRIMFKLKCRHAICRWRQVMHFDTTSQVRVINDKLHQVKIRHGQYLLDTKDQAACNAERIIVNHRLSNLLLAWKNVTKWQKAVRVQNQTLNDTIPHLMASCALKKWKQRTQVTFKGRQIIKKFQVKQRYNRLMQNFQAFRRSFIERRSFVKNVARIAAKIDNLLCQTGFKVIQNFAKSRDLVNGETKRNSALDLSSILHQLYLRRLNSHLSQLRSNIIKQRVRDRTIGNMMGHLFARGTRYHFRKWVQQTNLHKTIQEVNEIGPVVEQVLKEQLKYQNYANFLKDQGYDQNQIQDVQKWASDRSRELIAISVARMKHYTGMNDGYLKPKMFDRWKKYVKIRKLIRYLLQNMENRLCPLKADLSIAFNRWKYSHLKLNLQAQSKEHLLVKCVQNSRKADSLVQISDQAQDFKDQMAVQRDELVDNYMKSQKLGIALGRDNINRSTTKTLSRLLDYAHANRTQDIQQKLLNNISMIQTLKDKIKAFEQDNDSVAIENEELRQFSFNGYQLAKNVQALNKERESLSVDLADKAKTIKRLLQQNEQLSQMLRQFQEQSVNSGARH